MSEVDKSQENMYKFQILNQQAEQIGQQLEIIGEHLKNIEKLDENISDVKGKNGKEIYAEIGSGIYVKAELKEENFLVNVGDGKLVKKSEEGIKKILGEQKKRLEGIRFELNENLESLIEEIRRIAEEIKNSEKKESKIIT